MFEARNEKYNVRQGIQLLTAISSPIVFRGITVLAIIRIKLHARRTSVGEGGGWDVTGGERKVLRV